MENGKPLTLRPIQHSDLLPLTDIYAQHRAALGLTAREYPMPDATRPNIFQVAVGEREGRIIGGLYFEAEVEVMAISVDPLFMRLVEENRLKLEHSLRMRGYETLRAFIPQNLGKIGSMRRKGFTHMNPKWNCFVKTL